MMDRSLAISGSNNYIEYQKNWRFLMPIEALSLGTVGFCIAKEDGNNLPKIMTDVVLVGAIRWLVRDGVYQLLHDKNFFNLPNTDNTYFPQIEKLGTPLIKISFLIAVLIFKYFILPEL